MKSVNKIFIATTILAIGLSSCAKKADEAAQQQTDSVTTQTVTVNPLSFKTSKG